MKKTSRSLVVLMMALTTLTACQTTRLSDADRSVICKALRDSRVTVTQQEFDQLSPETVELLKRNPSIQRELLCP